MKKNFWNNFFMGILAMGLIAGCNNDEWDGNGTDPNPDLNDAVYMNVQVQLPVAGAGTRSNTTSGKDDEYGTSSDGTEVGKDYENKVSRVLLVLANQTTNEVVCYGTNDMDSEKTIVKSIHKINKTALTSYYTKHGNNGILPETDTKVKVYVFCNPTKALEDKVADDSDGSWINAAAEIEEKIEGSTHSVGGADGAAIWGGDTHRSGFLMSNAEENIKTIPTNIKDWDVYQSADRAFDLSGRNNANTDKEINNLGTIKVERSVARFDFKDGSKEGKFTYTLIDEATANENVRTPIVQVRLKRMGLVNMSKHFYYLRRVSDNGTDEGDNFKVGGVEYDKNYVVDTDAKEKATASLKEDNFQYGQYFNFCLGSGTGAKWTIDNNARSGWYNSLVTEVVGKETDSWKEQEYHIWRYVTENTVPAASAGQVYQKNGITTGIVFKGQIVVPEDAKSEKHKTLIEAIKNATGNSEDDPILYAYGSNLFVSWTEVRAYAMANKDDDKVFYEKVFGTPSVLPVIEKAADGDTPAVDAKYSDDKTSPDYAWGAWQNEKNNNSPTAEELLKEFKKVATGALFTLYQSSIDDDGTKGYYCYYYYWNRHNNNDLSLMGPMEFAVVRNNVYKLAVTGISQLGHPRIPENDPDPVDPDDPDESSDIYITLSVEVRPWVVRVNNIEF